MAQAGQPYAAIVDGYTDVGIATGSGGRHHTGRPPNDHAATQQQQSRRVTRKLRVIRYATNRHTSVEKTRFRVNSR
jgi:hypothetical protein